MIESSRTSAESSFRELDEVFLESQTRIWLGEVLNTRLDEDLHISDLLRDGEILFEVSKIVWNLLLTKCLELRHLKHKYGPFGSKKSSGRYRPYSNVDSFLKLCKILGLNGIDLFSPSDVVEKRNIRKVCICIRALSKKARSKQLSVPDFDSVIYSVTMPTDMVGGIRKSLESSQWTLSSSSSFSSQKGPRTKLKEKKLRATSHRDDDSSSEVSDEAESRYMGENSYSSPGKLYHADGVNSDPETSPETYSISGQYGRPNVDVKCQNTDEFNRGSNIFSPQNRNFTLENDDSVVGDSSCINLRNDYISDYLAFSDLMVHATDASNPVILDGEKNMFDFFLNVDSQEKRSYQNGSHRKYSDDEDMEVSSTTSMTSVLGRLLNLEFDDQFDAEDSSSANVYSIENKAEKMLHKSRLILSEPQKMESDMENGNAATDDNQETIICEDKPDLVDHIYNESDDTDIHSSTGQENLSRTISESQESCLPANITHDDVTSADKNGGQDKSEHVPVKHSKKPLLKTVVKGTAIAGVLFLLMQIRKTRANNAQGAKRFTRFSGFSGSSSSSRKEQTGSREKGVYPVEKLKL